MSEAPIWETGSFPGISIPANTAALIEGGTEFLTSAFRAFGALSENVGVDEIVSVESCPGGSTGQKRFLRVTYTRADSRLPTRLFVKFSRDFDDPIRDKGRSQMESEVYLAALSRHPDFPIRVPKCLFADFHRETGTGILITEQVPYGKGGIEPHVDKCLDDEIPDVLGHYRAIIDSLGRLAGTHRSGRLSPDVETAFPYDPAAAVKCDPIRYDRPQLLRRLSRYEAFSAAHPQLLPEAIRSSEFIDVLRGDIPAFLTAERAVKKRLHSVGPLIALCHWNANIDNAWFWRDPDEKLQCGLMDWGRVGQMNVAQALWGCLSAADPTMLEQHLDDLVHLFIDAFADTSGERLDAQSVHAHFQMYIATMALAWLMDAPALIGREIPDLENAADRYDRRFKENEVARTQLFMMTNVFSLWERYRFGETLLTFLTENRS